MTTVQQTGSIDLAAQNNAAKTATNYMSFDSTNGLKIAQSGPSNATKLVQITPSNGILIKNDANNYAKIDSGGLAVFQGNAAVASFGGTGSQIGPDSGGHSIVSSTGLEVFTDASTSVASFGNTSRIGKAYVSGATNNESHMELDYHSLQLFDKDGRSYFHVSDLRNESGYATISEYFIGNGQNRSFTLNYLPRSIDTTTVTTSQSSGITVTEITAYDMSVRLSATPVSGETVVITYQTNTYDAKGYTFGTRPYDSSVGPYSVAEGSLVTSAGYASHAEGDHSQALQADSHAEGYRTMAIAQHAHAEGVSTTAGGNGSHAEGAGSSAMGEVSHAEGGATSARAYYSHAQNYCTIAAKQAQTVLGTCNEEDTSTTTTHPSGNANYGKYALIIGNGTSDSDRSNALAVRWDGTIESAKEQFVIRSVTVSSVTASSYKTITAPTVAGYKFVCWIGSASSGSVRPTYINNPGAGVASVWNASSVTCNIQCWALYTWA